jgi:hypothetical protein
MRSISDAKTTSYSKPFLAFTIQNPILGNLLSPRNRCRILDTRECANPIVTRQNIASSNLLRYKSIIAHATGCRLRGNQSRLCNSYQWAGFNWFQLVASADFDLRTYHCIVIRFPPDRASGRESVVLVIPSLWCDDVIRRISVCLYYTLECILLGKHILHNLHTPDYVMCS